MTVKDAIQRMLLNGDRSLDKYMHFISRNPSLLWTDTYLTPRDGRASLLSAIFPWENSRELLREIDLILRKYADEHALTPKEEIEIRIAVFEENATHMINVIGYSGESFTLDLLIELAPHGVEIIDMYIDVLMMAVSSGPNTLFIDYLIQRSSYGTDLLLRSFNVESPSVSQDGSSRTMRVRPVIDTYRKYLRSLISMPVIIWAEDPRVYRELIIDSKDRPFSQSNSYKRLSINIENVRLIKKFRDSHQDELAQYYAKKEQELADKFYETLREETAHSSHNPINLPLLMSSVVQKQEELYNRRR